MDFTVYLVCLGSGLVFTLVSALMGQFGGHMGHVDGSGGHAEAGADGSDSPGVSIFSPTIIAAFMMAFGGFGVIFNRIPLTSPVYLSAPLAVVCGLIAAAVMVMLFRQLFKHTQSSSESQVASLAGQIATVITPIPQHAVGEIAYVQAGTRYTAPARSETGAAIAAGQEVRITRVSGSQFFVRSV